PHGAATAPTPETGARLSTPPTDPTLNELNNTVPASSLTNHRQTTITEEHAYHHTQQLNRPSDAPHPVVHVVSSHCNAPPGGARTNHRGGAKSSWQTQTASLHRWGCR